MGGEITDDLDEVFHDHVQEGSNTPLEFYSTVREWKDDLPLSETPIDHLEALAEKDPEDMDDDEITSFIRLSIKNRFDAPEHIMGFEFQNKEGKRADAIAINTMPSRNFPIIGFEFKASRTDWLNEKRDHSKADYFVQLCDEWYVVAGRTGIIEEHELPDGWGFLEIKPNSGQVWKKRDSNLNEMQSIEPDRRFYSRFLRHVIGSNSNFSKADIREAEKRGYERAKEKEIDDHLPYSKEKRMEKAQAFDELSDSPLDIFSWSDERLEHLKAAYDFLQALNSDSFSSIEGRLDSIVEGVERRQEQLAEDIGMIKEDLEELRGVHDEW